MKLKNSPHYFYSEVFLFFCALLLCPKFRKFIFSVWRGAHLEQIITVINSPTLKISHFLAYFSSLYYKVIQIH